MITNKYAKVLENKLINDQFAMISLENIDSVIASPGQFLNIYLNKGDKIMPRPFSVFSSDDRRISVVYKILGEGTRILSTIKTGEKLRLVYPLGNSFPEKEGSIALVGGGVGIPPLIYYLRNKLNGSNLDFYYGARSTRELILTDQISELTENLYISTDDGSSGIKGNVITSLVSSEKKYNTILACGPYPMLKALHEYAEENNTELYVSLEERMGCGFGVCMGCVVAVTNKKDDEEPYVRVCKDGPVFSADIIRWD